METKEVYALVVCPHADDAEFAAAGTVARWTREGKEVIYVVCTKGDKGTSDRTVKPEDLVAVREKEQLAAARELGVREVVFLRYPDQGLEDTHGFRKDIVRQIRVFRPQVVLGPDPYRRYIWHRDHRIAGQVVLDAVYPFARDHLAYPDLLEQGYEPHRVKEIYMWSLDDVNYRSDISDTFDIKMAALRCHRSQVGEDFERIQGWLRERAAQLAQGETFALAEGFHYVDITW
ncbi:MAG: PIG-L family deacetylase [Chloroflexi bacterium]|nr:PIG-L family deacetylase [Chloroflexota bacterium]